MSTTTVESGAATPNLKDVTENSNGVVNLPSSKTIIFYAYAFLLSLGVALYIIWGIAFGSWNIFVAQNIGIYALVIVMVVFGVAGMLLYSRD